MNKKAKPNIMIVEDEVDLSTLIAEELEESNMFTQICHNGIKAESLLSNQFFNLILLDINLPDMSGFDLLEKIRKNEDYTPVIFLTANDSEIDKIKGFGLGADDFINKPFSIAELIARIQAVLRRSETARDYHISSDICLKDDSFSFCGAQICPQNLEIKFKNGVIEKIGKKELGIIIHLYNQSNKVVPRKNLIHAVWGIHANPKSRSLDQYIVNIRNRFEKASCSTKSFQTIHGVGYFYNGEQS